VHPYLFSLRCRYCSQMERRALIAEERAAEAVLVGRCRLTVSKPVLKAPIVQRLKLQYDEPLSNFAFNFNLCRYVLVERKVGRCRLTL
jgi:hypothetical protein